VSFASARITAVFRPRNARRLFGVRVFGQAGDGLLQTALATFVLFSPQREADPKRIALAFAILLVPYSVVGPFVGIFIDRWSRRGILIRANLLRAITMVCIALVVTHHSANSTLALLVLLSLGINRFVQAALSASIPHVVDGDQLVTANALFPTAGTMFASVSAACGIATQKILSNSDTVNAGLIVCAAGLALSASFIGASISPPQLLGPHSQEARVREAIGNVYAGLIDGYRVLRNSAISIRSMAAVACQRFAFGVLTVHILLLSRSIWNPASKPDSAVTDFGIAAGCAALGAVAAALISASVLADTPGTRTFKHTKLIRTSLVVTATSAPLSALLLYSHNKVSAFATAFVLAFAGQFLKISADTSVQQNIDDEHRGRVFSIFDMVINVSIVSGISLYALSSGIREKTIPTVLIVSAALVLCAFLVQRASTSSRQANN